MTCVEVVITGGPHAGRASVISHLQQTLLQYNWRVLVVPDTLQLLDASGWDEMTSALASRLVASQHALRLQWQKMGDEIARQTGQKVVLLHPRAAFDFAPWIDDFPLVLMQEGLTLKDVRDSYALVIHMNSVALAEVPYAFTDISREDAVARDEKIMNAWVGFSHLRVIGPTLEFQDKVTRALQSCLRVMGIPAHEMERKYIVKGLPDLSGVNAQAVQITQTYLLSRDPEIEIRIRRRVQDAHATYYRTTKRRIDNLTREEYESIITLREYNELLLQRDPSLCQIEKTRYCFVDKTSYLELDVFSAPIQLVVLEAEVESKDEVVHLPSWLGETLEVTGDDYWRNYRIAERGIT